MKNDIPLHALTISYLGAITSFVTDAKSVFGALAALASFVASLYAIAIARKRLKRLRPATKPSLASRLKKLRRAVAGLFALTLIVGLTGCATPGNQSGQSVINRIAAIPGRVLDSAATLVTATATNVIEQTIVSPVATATNSGLRTQDSELRFVTNTILVTNIVAIPATGITRTLDTAEAASGFLPPPYGEAAAGGLAIISTLLAAAVRRRNTMLKTVIQGVESAGETNVKESIFTQSLLNGTSPAIHALVKKSTEK